MAATKRRGIFVAAALLMSLMAAVIEANTVIPQPITGTSTCSDRCDRTKCVEPSQCPAGLTWDRCLCCRVCARREGDRCDLLAPLFNDTSDDHRNWIEAATNYAAHYVHGPCGTNLECKIRTDMEEEEIPEEERLSLQPETTCVCMDQNPRCGTDNQTYATLCSLKEESLTQDPNDPKPKVPVELKHVGPCESAPKIMQPIENHVSAVYGSNVMFTCDIAGYPLPQVTWQLQTVDGQIRILPDGDGRISVSSRGASRPDRVTSWLQVIQVSREHEGDYTCTVGNGLGEEAKSTGRLLVAKYNGPAKTSEDGKSHEFFEDEKRSHLMAKKRKGRSLTDDDNKQINEDEIQQIVLDDDAPGRTAAGGDEFEPIDDSSEF